MRLAFALLLSACAGGDEAPSSTPPSVAEVPASAPAADPEAPPAAPTEPRYAASHILIAWAGAVGAPETVTRTEAEAIALAEELRRRALAGEDLADLARAHSDGPSGPRGGSLGVYETGTMVPAFEAAVAATEVGAIGPVVVTPFGAHVIRRDAVIEGRFAHIVVSHAGAWRSTSTRSIAEAQTRIERARAALDAGEAWDAVAARFSEDATAPHGGDLGRVAPGQLIPDFEDAAFALEVGETSDVVRTPYGLHIIRRLE